MPSDNELKDKPSGIRVQEHDAVVIAGSDLRQWATRRGRAGLSQDAVASIWQALDRHTKYLDEREGASPPGFAPWGRR